MNLTPNVQTQVNALLNELEGTRRVRVLFAVESGSRA
jgi:hypothetical protein